MIDPFDYTKGEEWLAAVQKKARQDAQRRYREKKLGRPMGKHGGYRPNAGRPSNRKYDYWIGVKVNNIQKLLLEELGGTVQGGIQKLIETHC